MAIGTGAALLGSAVIGAGASILGGKSQKKAAQKAADSSLAVAEKNNALAREIYGKNQDNLKPFMQSGVNAGNQVNALLANGPYDGGNINSTFVNTMDPGSFDDWKKNTGYDFNLERGLKGIGIGAGAGGWLQSGAAIKGALDFMGNLGSREYMNYRAAKDRFGSYADSFANQERAYDTDRYNEYLAQLTGQQGMGLTAANALAGVGTNFVNTVSSNNNSAGTVAANAALAQGAANQNMYAGIGNALGQFAGSLYNPTISGAGKYGVNSGKYGIYS